MFHICEGGKKISFLCPNGTIFQQTDLICDWWFKVNCAASPGHYAESSEVLSRAQNRHTTKEPKNLTATDDDEPSDNRKLTLTSRIKIASLNDEPISNENYDFEDISLPNHQNANALNTERRAKAYGRDVSKTAAQETQEAAASSSFVGNQQQNSFTGYQYREPTDKKFTLSADRKPEQNSRAQSQGGDVTSATTTSPTFTRNDNNGQFQGYFYQDPDRSSRRLETTQTPPNRYTQAPTTTASPVTYPRRGTTTYKNSLKQNVDQNQFIINVADTTIRATTQSTQTKDTTTTVPTTKPTTQPPPLIRNKSGSVTTRGRFETARTTPFYTPTVPTIISTRPTVSNRLSSERRGSAPTVSTLDVAEHAMEMMKTLQELKLDTKEAEKEMGGRPGLIIPPSSGPETLHSLALYFATAADGAVTKPTDPTTIKALEGLDVQIGNVTKLESTLVSDGTKRRYESLFGNKEIAQTTNTASKTSTTEASASTIERLVSSRDNDLETEFSNNPIIAAAGSPQIRELAQVFTHALSAYLHDPNTFRRVLSEIRPTEPPTTRAFEFLTNRVGRTEDFNKGTGPTYLPTSATPSATGTTTPITPTTEDLEVLDFSDVTLSTVRSKDAGSGEVTTQTETATSSTPSSGEVTATPHSHILSESLKQIDHVPASRILSDALENYANQYTSNSLSEGTTETSNPLAMEINGGLEATTIFPYLDEIETNENNGSSYFPAGKNPSHEDIRSQQPYGSDVKPANSTPIHSQSLPTESVRNSWKSDGSTTENPSHGTTHSPIALSFDLLPPATVNKGFSLPTHDILPPVDDNDLQRAQSQSIYGNGKNNLESQRTGKASADSAHQWKGLDRQISGHFITQITPTVTASPVDVGKVSPNPWSTLAYTVFLDPLTINDGLMGSNEQGATVTPSPHTYLPHSTQTPTYADIYRASTTPTTNQFASRLSLQELAAGGSIDNRQGKAIVTTATPSTHDDYIDVMQRKANEMFGQLNDTSANHLMNVMKKADKSKTVRRLILLLIQTCDDDYNTTVEQSRAALLNALIGMDGKIDDENELQIIRANRRGKNLPSKYNAAAATATTTTQLPITTYHRPLRLRAEVTPPSTVSPQYLYDSTATEAAIDAETTTNYYRSTGYTEAYTDYSTTTEAIDVETTTQYQTTTSPPPTTTTTTTTSRPTTVVTTSPRPVARRKSPTSQNQMRNSKRISKDLDQYLTHPTDSKLEVNAAHKNSDARALELLRSLYSLAGRFGK